MPTPSVPVIAESSKHLRELIQQELSLRGNKCDLNYIDVSRVKNMASLFSGPASSFNGNISKWDVSGVTDMSWMFAQSQFDGDISRWNTSRVRTMECMFRDGMFDRSIDAWDVGRVETMSGMFTNSRFNRELRYWDTSSVHNMSHMFSRSAFDQNIANWDVSRVEVFTGMFSKSPFDGDLSRWDVFGGVIFAKMFEFSRFNGDISNWNMLHAHSVEYMFENARFDQDVSEWALYDTPFKAGMFKGNEAGLYNQRMSDWVIGYYAENGIMHLDPRWQEVLEQYEETKDLLALSNAATATHLRMQHAQKVSAGTPSTNNLDNPAV